MNKNLYDAYLHGIEMYESGKVLEAQHTFDNVIRNLTRYPQVEPFADIFKHFTAAAKRAGRFNWTFVLFQEYLSLFKTTNELYPQLISQFCSFVLFSFETITQDTKAQLKNLQNELEELKIAAFHRRPQVNSGLMDDRKSSVRTTRYKAIAEEVPEMPPPSYTTPVNQQVQSTIPQPEQAEIPSSQYNASVTSRDNRLVFMQGKQVCSMLNSADILLNKMAGVPKFIQQRGGYFLIENNGDGRYYSMYPNFGIDITNSNAFELISSSFTIYGNIRDGVKVFVYTPALVDANFNREFTLHQKGVLIVE